MKPLYKFSFAILAILILASCAPQITRKTAYPDFYDTKPLSVLIMPPINRSTEVEAKEYFHTTLHQPLAERGYYVIPPFLSMDVMKQESAYDAELFLDANLSKFGEIFGADVAIFTIIHEWDKSHLGGNVRVKVQYIVRDVKTGEIFFDRTGRIVYDTSVNAGSGWAGALASVAATALNTGLTQYVNLARDCNGYALKDLPASQYSPEFQVDAEAISGPKEFQVTFN